MKFSNYYLKLTAQEKRDLCAKMQCSAAHLSLIAHGKRAPSHWFAQGLNLMCAKKFKFESLPKIK